jgi:hypothetical protein
MPALRLLVTTYNNGMAAVEDRKGQRIFIFPEFYLFAYSNFN